MSYTLTQKILMRNAGVDHVIPGDVVSVKPNYIMNHEGAAERSQMLRRMGFKTVADPNQLINFFDHDTLASSYIAIDRRSEVFSFDKRYNISHSHACEGICHTLVPEYKYCKPGTVIFGADSHTCTYGACACFSTGTGVTDNVAMIGSGRTWARIPAGIKIVIEGQLPKGVFSKDVILRVLGDIRSDGGQYKSLEFCGSTIRSMSMSSRLTMTNMAVECGAKNGIVEADEVTAAFFDMDIKEIEWLKCGPDDAYERVIRYDAADFVPMVSCPPYVDTVKPISEVEGTKLTQVFFGSCTNSSLEDFEIFASVIRGKKVEDDFKLLVSPGSVKIFKQAMELGYIHDILEAGALVVSPTCGLCYGGTFGLMDEKGVMLGTNNRNFRGRHGDRNAKCFLGSPATAAASAINGCITDPRIYF